MPASMLGFWLRNVQTTCWPGSAGSMSSVAVNGMVVAIGSSPSGVHS
jgi:hypothetical protein